MLIGLIAGCLQICIPVSDKPLPPVVILGGYTSGFAILSLFAGIWLKKKSGEESPGRDPDPTGLAGWLVSFGFGALFGVFLVVMVISWLPGFGSALVNWALFIGCVGGCGVLSAAFGDKFWRGLSE